MTRPRGDLVSAAPLEVTLVFWIPADDDDANDDAVRVSCAVIRRPTPTGGASSAPSRLPSSHAENEIT